MFFYVADVSTPIKLPLNGHWPTIDGRLLRVLIADIRRTGVTCPSTDEGVKFGWALASNLAGWGNISPVGSDSLLINRLCSRTDV